MGRITRNNSWRFNFLSDEVISNARSVRLEVQCRTNKIQGGMTGNQEGRLLLSFTSSYYPLGRQLRVETIPLVFLRGCPGRSASARRRGVGFRLR